MLYGITKTREVRRMKALDLDETEFLNTKGIKVNTNAAFDKTEQAYRELCDKSKGVLSTREMELVDILEAFRLCAIVAMTNEEVK